MTNHDIILRNREHEREKAQSRIAEIATEIFRLQRQQTALLIAKDYAEDHDLKLLGLRTRIAELQRSIGHLLFWALAYGAANFHFDMPDEGVYEAYLEMREE